MKQILKRCPFCGGEADVFRIPENTRKRWRRIRTGDGITQGNGSSVATETRPSVSET